jgi:hypothetical protein
VPTPLDSHVVVPNAPSTISAMLSQRDA